MKRKLIFGIFIISIVFYLLSNKTQAIAASLNFEEQGRESSICSLSTTSSKLVDLSLVPHEPIEILNDGNFTDYGFPGTGDEYSPYIIEEFSITTTAENAIEIYGTTKYFIIQGCFLDGAGISISNVADGTALIQNNTCVNSIAYGILLSFTNYATISNNTCSENSVGIYLYHSDFSLVENNTCSNNIQRGIYLDYSSGNILVGNECNNSRKGIHLYICELTILTSNICNNNSDYGIILYSTDGTVLTENVLINNSMYGIQCFGINCILTYNHLENNGFYGISLTSFPMRSNFHIVYHNVLIDNNPGDLFQASDNGTENTWYDILTNEGNFWSDWDGTGAHLIGGHSRSYDLYPLDEYGKPYDGEDMPPLISHPPDMIIEEGTLNMYITWNPDDLHPFSYTILRNGTIILEDNWYGDPLVISIGKLEIGKYEFVCAVYDLYDNSISDTVIVTIIKSTTEKSNLEMIIMLYSLILIPYLSNKRRKSI